MNVEAYGSITDLPWKMGVPTPNGTIFVHPTFLYESIADFLIFILLVKISKRRAFPGQMVSVYLIGYSFVRFWIEGLRSDSLMLGPFRISQIVSLILFTIGIGFIDIKRRKKTEKYMKIAEHSILFNSLERCHKKEKTGRK